MVSECRYCGYRPVAWNAMACPNCGGLKPYPWDLTWLILGVIALGVFWYFLEWVASFNQ